MYLKTRYRSRVKFLRFEISHIRGSFQILYTHRQPPMIIPNRHHFSSTNLCLVILSCIFEWIDLTNLIGSVEVYSITISVLLDTTEKKIILSHKDSNLLSFFLRLALYIFKPIFISEKISVFRKKMCGNNDAVDVDFRFFR